MLLSADTDVSDTCGAGMSKSRMLTSEAPVLQGTVAMPAACCPLFLL